jgi:hypothetical protein
LQIKSVLSSQKKWLQFSLFNLLLVALLGVTLRYKIAFSLPFIDQQKLLHGHSHFAFAGWVTQALMTLLVGYLSEHSSRDYFPKYRWILYFNAFTAYGMLISFPIQGYAFVSILFSTLSVFASYYFAFIFWKDLNQIPKKSVSHSWFKLALLGNVVSSAGPFSLAFMMASHNMHANWYLASIYFYLHFQYNVWFFFTCMGLLSYRLASNLISEERLRKVWLYFALAAFPTYFLSVLWWHIPDWLYVVVVFAAISQLIGLACLFTIIKKNREALQLNMPMFSRILFCFFVLALSIKLVLQAASVVPVISKMAYGFRPIVIGYLHLILLGIITIFLLAYFLTYRLIHTNPLTKKGVIVFVSGIIVNELLLMFQGILDLFGTGIPGIQFLLLLASCILFSGILIIFYAQLFSKDDWNHKMAEMV